MGVTTLGGDLSILMGDSFQDDILQTRVNQLRFGAGNLLRVGNGLT